MSPIRQPRRAGLLLETGQVTQYSSEKDDGYYEVGLNKRYSVLTLGQYSGTSNIDLAHFSGSDLTFAHVAGSYDTITSGSALEDIFNAGDAFLCAGAGEAGNNETAFAIFSAASGVISCVTTTTLTDEAAGATITISKREALSNNCVQDLVTGRMWARYTSAEENAMGTASDGRMPWTGKLYDIFQYAAAANSASLGGLTGWRMANRAELMSLVNSEPLTGVPDSVAFPSWPAGYFWSTTVRPDSVGQKVNVNYDEGTVGRQPTTLSYYVALVRGGV